MNKCKKETKVTTNEAKDTPDYPWNFPLLENRASHGAAHSKLQEQKHVPNHDHDQIIAPWPVFAVRKILSLVNRAHRVIKSALG